MDPMRPTAQAMAVVDGRIAAIGARNEIAARFGRDARTLSFEGGAILPGLIDTHNHLLRTAMQERLADLSQCRSVSDVLDAVAAYARANPDKPWIASGMGWHVVNLEEGRYPTRKELDSVCPDRPVYLPRVGHAAVANSRALRLAGIDRHTVDPLGGRIEKDEEGEPSGVLLARPAFDLVGRLVPPAALDEVLQAILDMQAKYHACGITGLIEPGLSREDFAAYRQLHEDGRLTIRTVAMPMAATGAGDDEMIADLQAWQGRTGQGDQRLKLGGVKVVLDGGASLGTSLMREPYPGDPCNCGIQVTQTETLHRLAEYCAGHGWSMGVHAVGGRAIDIVMSTFDAVDRLHPIRDLRFHVIHAYLWPSKGNIETAARLGIGVATQASMQYQFAPILVKRMGARAVGRATPIRDWMDAGVIVGGGSDSPVTPYQPLLGIWHAVTRWVDALTLVLGREQAISAQQALEMYTTNAAWLSFAEGERGMLKEGMLADWVSLAVDPLECDPHAIKTVKVQATAVGGELVHMAP